MNKFLSNSIVSVSLGFLYLLSSGAFSVVLLFSDHHIMERLYIRTLVLVIIIVGILLIYYAVKGIGKRNSGWLLFFLTIPFSLISLIIVVLPVFDQLGWFGF